MVHGVYDIDEHRWTTNATVLQALIDRAYEDDPAVASAESGAAFPTDVQSFVSREAVEACVVPDRRELPPISRTTYRAFTDPSGGSVDSMTLAIGHRECEVAILDAVRERRSSFSPSDVVGEFVNLLKRYGVYRVPKHREAGCLFLRTADRH